MTRSDSSIIPLYEKTSSDMRDDSSYLDVGLQRGSLNNDDWRSIGADRNGGRIDCEIFVGVFVCSGFVSGLKPGSDSYISY